MNLVDETIQHGYIIHTSPLPTREQLYYSGCKIANTEIKSQ